MKHLWIVIAVLIMPAAPAMAKPPKTVIEDQAEAELLLGKHLFTSSNLATSDLFSAYVNFGEARIHEKNGTFFIEADHTCYQRMPRYPKDIEGGHVKLKGKILSVKKDEFTFRGTIFGYMLPFTMANPETFDCSVDDTFTFSRKTHPKYWRLQLTQSSFYYDLPKNRHKLCLQFFSTPDIFSAPLEGNAPHKCARTLEGARKSPMPYED